ncbi:hypothetical protein PHYPSEUDO_004916 [Phytophthora pseudosyringae]|uniref:Uncharacterized protein n=1 Tax=Phytophthora pseudosyringae TaxID=221518 RepID=A0A8T1WDV1_9STRA|nr:hypothetical protein PHYPSEUDO_004916 [Phytophthora pseudosyringae]
MLDVKAVGSNLTPAQQEETLVDLRFFLDVFGSTSAVRSKLLVQESAIKRLGGQVRHLLDHRDNKFPQEVEENHTQPPDSSIKNDEDVDEIMADIDFFLRTFGSTRAAREKLEGQRQEIVGLRRTLQSLEERQERGKRETRRGVAHVVTVQNDNEKANGNNGDDGKAKETTKNIVDRDGSVDDHPVKASDEAVTTPHTNGKHLDEARTTQAVSGALALTTVQRMDQIDTRDIAASGPLLTDYAMATAVFICARLKAAAKEQYRLCDVITEAALSASRRV